MCPRKPHLDSIFITCLLYRTKLCAILHNFEDTPETINLLRERESPKKLKKETFFFQHEIQYELPFFYCEPGAWPTYLSRFGRFKWAKFWSWTAYIEAVTIRSLYRREHKSKLTELHANRVGSSVRIERRSTLMDVHNIQRNCTKTKRMKTLGIPLSATILGGHLALLRLA